MYAIRDPAAAGLLYNADKDSLRREIDGFFNGKNGPKEFDNQNLTAVITPHNNYHLCGPICAWSYSKIEKANYVIIGPNHHDLGSKFAVMKEGLWKTPLGEVVVSNKVAQKIIDKSNLVEYDVTAHKNEHSIEVQLPFLQFRYGNDFKIVPVSITNKFEDKDFLENCERIGKAIAQSIISEDEKWLVIATTDFSRGPKSNVESVDKLLVNSLKNLSGRSFFNSVHKNMSYICGYGAVLAALSAAKELKAKRSRLLKYASSMEVVKDPKSFVGYASIIIY